VAEILTPEQLYEAAVKISASEGLGGATWVMVKAHDAALRTALDAANKCTDDAIKSADRRGSAMSRALDRADKADADLAAMTAERNSLRLALDANADQLAQEIATARTLCEQRAAALARVAELEAQRDEARRMFCVGIATYASEGAYPGPGGKARQVCLVFWPADADRLYPPDGR
jgi:ABC-type transporter Mla subunit MlaD